MAQDEKDKDLLPSLCKEVGDGARLRLLLPNINLPALVLHHNTTTISFIH